MRVFGKFLLLSAGIALAGCQTTTGSAPQVSVTRASVDSALKQQSDKVIGLCLAFARGEALTEDRLRAQGFERYLNSHVQSTNGVSVTLLKNDRRRTCGGSYLGKIGMNIYNVLPFIEQALADEGFRPVSSSSSRKRRFTDGTLTVELSGSSSESYGVFGVGYDLKPISNAS